MVGAYDRKQQQNGLKMAVCNTDRLQTTHFNKCF